VDIHNDILWIFGIQFFCKLFCKLFCKFFYKFFGKIEILNFIKLLFILIKNYQIMISEEEIRDTFYNMLMNHALNLSGEGSGVFDFSDKRVIESLIKSILLDIAESEHLITLSNKKVTMENVPIVYLNLFIALHRLREIVRQFTEKNTLTEYLDFDKQRDKQKIDHMVNQIIQEIERQQTFQPIIGKFIVFYKQCIQPSPIQSIEVNVREIRSTFYELMASEVLNKDHVTGKGLIPRSDLIDCEAYIFMGLSGLVICAVLEMSKDSHGIRLLNGGIVNEMNCPNEFKDLFVAVNGLKKIFNDLNPNPQIMRFLKICALQNESIEPQELTIYRIPQIMKVVSEINSISTQISRIDHFKQIINDVIGFCIGAMEDDFV
jgi:hypothetical protein